MDLIEIMWKGECVNWIHLAQDKGPVAASGSIKNGKFLQYLNNKQILGNDSAPRRQFTFLLSLIAQRGALDCVAKKTG